LRDLTAQVMPGDVVKHGESHDKIERRFRQPFLPPGLGKLALEKYRPRSLWQVSAGLVQ
jgi:hypothetical protein